MHRAKEVLQKVRFLPIKIARPIRLARALAVPPSRTHQGPVFAARRGNGLFAHDGMALSAERTEAFKEAFDLIGTNKAETVDERTMGIIMRSLGQNPASDEVSALFKKHSGGSKAVGVEAVLAAAGEFEATMAGKDLKADMKEAFAVFDKDKSGKISAA